MVRQRRAGRGARVHAAAGRSHVAFDEGPILGLFGSDHPVTAAQIDACDDLALSIGEDGNGALGGARPGCGVTVSSWSAQLHVGLDRRTAADLIERRFATLVAQIRRPGTVLVAGGETLRGLCHALGADHLDLAGEIVPGVAVSRIGGGCFDGVRVVRKSGAFGDVDLRRLLADRCAPASLRAQGNTA